MWSRSPTRARTGWRRRRPPWRSWIGLGYRVVVEQGAGTAPGSPMPAYAGAELVSGDRAWGSDVVLKVAVPTEAEVSGSGPRRRAGGLLALACNQRLVSALAEQGPAMLMDAVPRLRAQSMDVLEFDGQYRLATAP